MKSNRDKCKVLPSIPQIKQTSIESETEVNVNKIGDLSQALSSGIINSLVYSTFIQLRNTINSRQGRHYGYVWKYNSNYDRAVPKSFLHKSCSTETISPHTDDGILFASSCPSVREGIFNLGWRTKDVGVKDIHLWISEDCYKERELDLS